MFDKIMFREKPKYINTGGKLLDLSKPRVMGILNITPDSFFGGSRLTSDNEIINTAIRMNSEGADILDIGGYSSRPGATDIPPEEESRRVLHAIKLIIKELPDVIVSVDTFRAGIAREAVEVCGALIINDISGGDLDEKMLTVVKMLNVPYIMMHMKGTPQTMQKNPVYHDVVADMLKWFGEKIYNLRSAGVKDIIIDPGFGFGKTTEHNFEIMNRLGDFSITGLPLMVGLSRKGMIWKTLGISPDDALNGTTSLNTVALLKGADILRVHDVKEAVETIKLVMKMRDHEAAQRSSDFNIPSS